MFKNRNDTILHCCSWEHNADAPVFWRAIYSVPSPPTGTGPVITQSLTSRPYMPCSVHTSLLAMSHCLQEGSCLKAFILLAALPGPSLSQIYLQWAQLKILSYSKSLFKIKIPPEHFISLFIPSFFFHSIHTVQLIFLFGIYLHTSRTKTP